MQCSSYHQAEGKNTPSELICGGKALLDSYFHISENSIRPNQPLMLPPAFRQTFVDKYTDEDLKVAKKTTSDAQRINFDAECAVYDTLQTLDERITVLHGFKYTENQWKTFVNDGKLGQAGEHDFIVIFPSGTIICIEVKNPSSSKSQKRAISEASTQLKRLEKFLNGISEVLQVKHDFVKFCALPFINENDSFSMQNHKVEGISFIWKEDLKNLNGKIDSYLKEDDSGTSFEIQDLIVGLWIDNYDQEGQKNPSYWNVYGNLIDVIDAGIDRGRNLAGAGAGTGTKLNQPGPGLTGILKCCRGRGRGRDWLQCAGAGAGAGIFLL